MSEESTGVGYVLTAEFSHTGDPEKRKLVGGLVYWSKNGWTDSYIHSTHIIGKEDNSHVQSLIDLHRAASKQTSEIAPGSIKFQEVHLRQINWSDGEILNERQYLALQKLTLDEIEALGIKSMAVIHKLTKG